MAECLVIGKSNHLETEHSSIKAQKEETRKKRRRCLEVMSLACSTLGLNIIIASFYGLTNSFGFKSPDVIFQCAFVFLLASVLLGVLAMISSANGYEFLHISSLSSPIYSLCRFLRRLYSSRNNYYQEPVIIYKLEKNQSASATSENNIALKCLNDEQGVNPKDCGNLPETSEQSSLLSKMKYRPSETKAHVRVPHSTNGKFTDDPKISAPSITSEPGKNEIVFVTSSKTNHNNQRTPECYSYDSFQPSKGSIKHHGLSAEAARQSYTLSPCKCNKQSDNKAILQLRKRPNTFSIDESPATSNSSVFTKASRLISWDVERDCEKTRLTLMEQNCFVVEVDRNKEPFQIQLNPREIASRCLPGVANPYEIRNAYSEEGRGYNFQERCFPSTYQRFPNDHVSDVISKINKMNFLS